MTRTRESIADLSRLGVTKTPEEALGACNICLIHVLRYTDIISLFFRHLFTLVERQTPFQYSTYGQFLKIRISLSYATQS